MMYFQNTFVLFFVCFLSSTDFIKNFHVPKRVYIYYWALYKLFKFNFKVIFVYVPWFSVFGDDLCPLV
jgi:hypothetical protein